METKPRHHAEKGPLSGNTLLPLNREEHCEVLAGTEAESLVLESGGRGCTWVLPFLVMELGESLNISEPLHLMPPPRATGTAPQKCELVPLLQFLLTLKPGSSNYGPQGTSVLGLVLYCPQAQNGFYIVRGL